MCKRQALRVLFVCYINDLPKYCTEMRPYLFADDTALVISDHCLEVIQSKLQNILNILLQWFTTNKLSLNVSKTKWMLICNNRSPFRNFNLYITDNDIPIDSVDTIKYLGLHVNRHRSFDAHIENIVKKVSQRNRLLWKMHNSIQFNSIQFNSIQFNIIYLTSVQVMLVPVNRHSKMPKH